ncbi:MAG: RNA polymerase sigma factor [Bacteroidota bacterium]
MHIPPDLIEACVKDDRMAQSELYRLCFGTLMGVCLRYHSHEEDAIEVLNQGFLKILNNLHKRKPKVPFEAWIRRIMINTLIDDFRKNRRRKELFEVSNFEESSQGQSSQINFNTADEMFDAQEIEAMIQQLPPMTRQVFNLHAIDGFSHKEISQQLGISEGTSKWHVNAARKNIKKQFSIMYKHKKNVSL